MPITRTPIVDDSGSGTDGTVIDNAWKQELYNQIDAFSPAPYRLASAIYTTLSPTTLADYQPAGGPGAVVWFVSTTAGASCDVTGIVAEADLTMHLLVNTASLPINFYALHASSAAANRILTPGLVTYTLASWRSAWFLYAALHGGWIILNE